MPTVPFDGELNVSEPAAEMVRLSGPVELMTGVLESVAMTVMVDVPAMLGVPLTTQPADKVRPAGRAPPVCEHV